MTDKEIKEEVIKRITELGFCWQKEEQRYIDMPGLVSLYISFDEEGFTIKEPEAKSNKEIKERRLTFEQVRKSRDAAPREIINIEIIAICLGCYSITPIKDK